jgi:hypothetical protein
MKNYLNSDERMQNVFIAVVYGIITVYLENKSNYTAEEIKWLESASMSLYEYIQALGDRVGDKELFRIHKMSKEYKTILRPRSDKCDGQFIVDKNAIEEVCRMAVEAYCFGCERVDYQNCPLCQFMDKIGMGVNEEQEGKCTYWYQKE